jgi:hypothetical protein
MCDSSTKLEIKGCSYAFDEKTVNRRIAIITPTGTGINFKSRVFILTPTVFLT